MLFKVIVAAAVVASLGLAYAELLLAGLKAHAHQVVSSAQIVGTKFASTTLLSEMSAIEQTLTTQNNPYGSLPLPSAMAAQPACASSTACGMSVSATYSYDGDTSTNTNADVVTAPNVESEASVSERRVAVTITLNVINAAGTVLDSRPQRVYVRLWEPNNAEIVAIQDSSAKMNRVAVGSAENAGCSETGSGCDPNAPGLAAPTTIDATLNCQNGYGSGTCAVGATRSVANKVNLNWSDAQSVSSGGP